MREKAKKRKKKKRLSPIQTEKAKTFVFIDSGHFNCQNARCYGGWSVHALQTFSTELYLPDR